MKRKDGVLLKITAAVTAVIFFIILLNFFHEPTVDFILRTVMLSARVNFPAQGRYSEQAAPDVSVSTTEKKEESDMASGENIRQEEEAEPVNLSETDSDIVEAMKEAESSAAEDKKDGAISEYTYTNDSVTDSFGVIRVKNVNNTPIDIEAELQKKPDLCVDKDKPAVLIYHTHTTETYQLLDRDFYAEGFKSRTDDKNLNMVRVGKAVCEEIERAGYSVIHVTDIHDDPYSGAYARSRSTVEEYLKKYPSIQITLDIHRDAIQRSDGTKIAPTVEINGKKAAQIMIISGCQEEGNGITNLPDWQYNLTFAVRLQYTLETMFKGITRPLYFCPRSYNMNLTHCSLLVEVGSDGNTLEEAVYTGKCLGTAIVEILKENEE